MSMDQEIKDWEFIRGEGYLTLKLNGTPKTESIPQFESELNAILKECDKYSIVVHCSDLVYLSLNWLRSLLRLEKQLLQSKRQLKLIHLTPDVAAFVKEQGVDMNRFVARSLPAVLAAFNLRKILDVDFINPFIDATLKVLEVQASTKAKAGRPYKKSENESFHGDISGVIGLISDSFTGSVVVSFPQATFLSLMDRMIGEKHTTLTKEIQDGAGELTNMIFGQSKLALNEKGYALQTALPSVVVGQNHSIQSVSQGPRLAIPFETDIGVFFIEICISE